MNGFDLTLAVLFGLAVLVGLIRGLTRIVVGLASLVVAFVVASRFHGAFADRLTWLAGNPEVRRLAAYFALFAGVLVVGVVVVAWLVSKMLKAVALGWADRLAGGAAGFVAAALLAALVILPLVAYVPGGGPLLERSTLAPYLSVVADLLNAAAPDDLAQRYRGRIEELRARWRRQAEAEAP